MKLTLVLSVLVFFTELEKTDGIDAVNVALNKKVSAQVTCGTYGEESYKLNSQIGLSTGERQTLYCSNGTHTPEDMVDGDTTTQWQSTSRYNIYNEGFGNSQFLEGTVILDLEQVHTDSTVNFYYLFVVVDVA